MNFKDYQSNQALDSWITEDIVDLIYFYQGDLQGVAEHIGCPLGKLVQLVKSDAALMESVGYAREWMMDMMYTQAVETLKGVMDTYTETPNPAVNAAKYVCGLYSPLHGINMKIKSTGDDSKTELEIYEELYQKGGVIDAGEPDEPQEDTDEDS